jgi:hypothetical protein
LALIELCVRRVSEAGASSRRLRRGVRRREEGYHLYPGESLQGPSRILIQNKQFTEGRQYAHTK